MKWLALVGAAVVVLVAASTPTLGQGRCVQGYGTPGCNARPIAPVFASTGWRTTALDHLTFRVPDPRKEAAFYAAVLGWTPRRDSGDQVVMDFGDRGTAIFTTGPANEKPAVVSLGFDIEPWNAGLVGAELRRRGLDPVAENGAAGFESFRIEDPDGFALQLSNGRGHTSARRSPHPLTVRLGAPFPPTGWQTVWLDHLSMNVRNYKVTTSFYTNLLGWQPTYDEGSQHELLIGNVGNIIVRGGNPFDPGFLRGQSGARGQVDHISFGIEPWDSDRVKIELEKRGLQASPDTVGGGDIHAAPYKSYHTKTPSGYDLQISFITQTTRSLLSGVVAPRRPAAR